MYNCAIVQKNCFILFLLIFKGKYILFDTFTKEVLSVIYIICILEIIFFIILIRLRTPLSLLEYLSIIYLMALSIHVTSFLSHEKILIY
jgi:hypothetical protein